MDESDALLAVVAHALLNSLGIIKMGVMTLEARPELDAVRRERLFEAVLDQANHMGAVLTDLVRGVPPDVVHALDELGDPQRARTESARA